ncbi:hypothetical protein PYCC9005_004293 [Savitreella phatthalungensis]
MSAPVLPPKPRGMTNDRPAPPALPTSTATTSAASLAVDLDDMRDLPLDALRSLLSDTRLVDAVYLSRHSLSRKHAAVLEGVRHDILLLHRDLHSSTVRTLSALRSQLRTAYEGLRERERVWEDVERRMYGALNTHTLDLYLPRVKAAADEAERVSDTLATTFLEHTTPSPQTTKKSPPHTPPVDDDADAFNYYGVDGGGGESSEGQEGVDEIVAPASGEENTAGDGEPGDVIEDKDEHVSKTDIDISDWIREYRTARELYHSRRERLARLREGRVGTLLG